MVLNFDALVLVAVRELLAWNIFVHRGGNFRIDLCRLWCRNLVVVAEYFIIQSLSQLRTWNMVVRFCASIALSMCELCNGYVFSFSWRILVFGVYFMSFGNLVINRRSFIVANVY